MRSTVCSNSCSVSPQNPTIKSDVSATPGIISLKSTQRVKIEKKYEESILILQIIIKFKVKTYTNPLLRT